MTLERAVIVELPWLNDEGRVAVDLTALPGARVVGEHLHPALHERFTVREGEAEGRREGPGGLHSKVWGKLQSASDAAGALVPPSC